PAPSFAPRCPGRSRSSASLLHLARPLHREQARCARRSLDGRAAACGGAMARHRWGIFLLLPTLALAFPALAAAHGLAGQRFFPATLAVDDPFVADELSFLTVSHRKLPGSEEGPPTRETDLSAEFSKRLTPNFGVSLAGTYKILDPDEGRTVTGFDNKEISLKYVFPKSDAHETIPPAGVSWDVGGTGRAKVGAESFDTVTPQLFFGKGMGDLPDAVRFLKPFAVTGVGGLARPL